MSWNAERVVRRGCFAYRYNRRREPRNPKVHGRKQRKSRAVSEERRYARFLSEIASRFTSEEVVRRIFGVSSLDRALALAVRVSRFKKRTPRAIVQEYFPSAVARHLRKRNNHHLTPRCRKAEMYHGNKAYNVLLMRIDRHKALHDEFGECTWEEIVVLLSAVLKLVHEWCFARAIEALIERGRGIFSFLPLALRRTFSYTDLSLAAAVFP